ncbi:MAG: hypothetical protein JWQ42_2234, partial [Edaphobacter sp.]|nr:hypothetical protein [Edaphobacter sp.]
MKLKWGGIILLTATAMMAQTSNQDKSADQLRDLASVAKNSGDLLAEATYICQAAALDSKKYEKKCARAKEDANKALVQFQIDLNTGRTEIQQKDYGGAFRDLGKITFGPNKAEAQDLTQLARIAGNGGTPVDLISYEAFKSAHAAYLRGDFDVAQSEAKRVQSPPLQNAINKLLTNIGIYRDMMKQAEALARSGDFKGAEQKYQFAIIIKQNGPGQPQDRLQEVRAAEAQAANAKPVPPPQPLVPVQPQTLSKATPPPHTSNDQGKTRMSSNPAPHEQKQGFGKDAQHLPKSSQANARKAEDVSNKKAASGNIQQDPEEAEGSLTQGVTDFYASHFSHADDAIEVYLQGGGTHYAGAAHFYLGA